MYLKKKIHSKVIGIVVIASVLVLSMGGKGFLINLRRCRICVGLIYSFSILLSSTPRFLSIIIVT